jgi:hypothetical protein
MYLWVITSKMVIQEPKIETTIGSPQIGKKAIFASLGNLLMMESNIKMVRKDIEKKNNMLPG